MSSLKRDYLGPHTLILIFPFLCLRMDKPEDKAKSPGAQEQKHYIKIKCAPKWFLSRNLETKFN